jgi:hypothetical protein
MDTADDHNTKGENANVESPKVGPGDTVSAKRVSVPPPGYQFVKVRKPDGTIVTVERKITNENAPPTSTPSSPTAIPLPASLPGSPIVDSFSQQHKGIGSRPQSDYSGDGAIGSEPGSPTQEKHRSKFRDSMIKGLGSVIGPMETVKIGEFNADDKIVNHEDDLSEDEFNYDINEANENEGDDNRLESKKLRRSDETECEGEMLAVHFCFIHITNTTMDMFSPTYRKRTGQSRQY